MISSFSCHDEHLMKSDDLAHAHWIDMLNPTPPEIERVQAVTGVYVSSAPELQEIESSSRQYVEDDTLYLSYPMVTKIDGQPPAVTSIGFVLARDRLVTVRYTDSKLFDLFAERLPKADVSRQGSVELLLSLLEMIVDRLADLLEHVRDELDTVSRVIFAGPGTRKPRDEDRMQRGLLTDVGRAGELVSRIRDSLLGIGRMLPYIHQISAEWMPPHDHAPLHPRLQTIKDDVQSLSDYDGHLTNKIQFLQDAILGFINIAQNNIIKVLTVVSVVGVPPTLMASIYGMNFKSMPELEWVYGYPYGLTVIALSAILPLVWFRVRGWL